MYVSVVIYGLLDPVTNKIRYVGSSKEIEHRVSRMPDMWSNIYSWANDDAS